MRRSHDEQDGSQKAGSRYGCTQQNIGTFTSRCSVDYHLAEVRGRSDPLAVSSVHVGELLVLPVSGSRQLSGF